MPKGRPLEIESELLEAFRRNGLVSEYLVGAVPSAIWRAAPPSGRGRSIAAIVAHMQSVRRMFARMGGARPGPRPLDRLRSTPVQAQRALRESTEVLARLFEAAIVARRARVNGMPRRVVNMMAYLMEHDAHHRGQICTLVRDLGYELRSEDIMRMWGWKRLPSEVSAGGSSASVS
jgi:uncharacterized damage-inducible protein DinB